MRRRLLLSYLSITVLVLLVLEIPLGFSFAGSERRRLEGDVQHDAFTLAIRAEDTLESNPEAPVRDLQALSDRYRRETGGRVVIVNANGEAVADSEPADRAADAIPRDFGSRPEIARALQGKESTGTRHSRTLGVDLLYVAVPVTSPNGVSGAVRVTYPMSFVSNRIRHNWLLLLATGGIVLAVVFLVSLWLARSVTRPLGELESAASRLGSGDLTTRAAVPVGPPEVRLLTEQFNTTAARLEELVGAQQSFVTDASHQLRTPLAALRLRLENLETEVTPEGGDDLEGAREEVQRLSRLVDGLLTLARAEQTASAPVIVDVAEVIDGRRDAWAAFAAERDVQIDTEVQGPLRARATPGKLEQILDNLLNNALDVAPAGSAVTIRARPARDRVELRVADAGPGMTEAQRARAFDRFWRSSAAPREYGGFGLGLSIVRQLVTSDGGEVELGTSPAGGLEVTIRVPAGG